MKIMPLSMGEIMRDMTLVVEFRLTRVRWYRFRLWLGSRIINLGAHVIGCGIEFKDCNGDSDLRRKHEDPRMNQDDRGPLSKNIKVDDREDIATIYGTKIAGRLLRTLGEPTPDGVWFRIIKAEYGISTIEQRRDL